MYHIRVAAATDLGANVKVMTGGTSALDDIFGFCGYRHMATVAMQAFYLVCCVCEILQTLGVAGTAEHVTTS